MRFSKHSRIAVLVGAALPLALVAPVVATNVVLKTGIIVFEGPATAFGSFQFRIVRRGHPCDGVPIRQTTVSYDELAPGPLPTSATEIRDSTMNGLLPVPTGFIYTASVFGGAPAIQIDSTNKADEKDAAFDVCVGAGNPLVYKRVLSAANPERFSQNGVIIVAGRKDKIPTVSAWGLAVMALLAASAGTVIVMRRRMAATT